MSLVCSSCRAFLVDGALRCRYCGSPTTTAGRTRGVGVSFSLEDVVPDAVQVGRLVDELAEFAPEVLRWWREADGPRKDRLCAILDELQGLLGRKRRD